MWHAYNLLHKFRARTNAMHELPCYKKRDLLCFNLGLPFFKKTFRKNMGKF